MKNIISFVFCGLIGSIILSGCSGAQKARKEERERLVQAKGIYCDFVSESDFKDIEIELNLRLAKKCDPNKQYSIINYKRVSENPGIMYCCNADSSAALNSSVISSPKTEPDPNQVDKKATPTTK